MVRPPNAIRKPSRIGAAQRYFLGLLSKALLRVLAFPLGCVCILALGVCCVVWGQDAGGEGAAPIGTSHPNHSGSDVASQKWNLECQRPRVPSEGLGNPLLNN